MGIEAALPRNTALMMHDFRESVDHALQLLRNLDRSCRELQREYLKNEYDILADEHKKQAFWHIAGIAGGVFEIASIFFPGWEGVCKGLSTATVQSVGIGQKFSEKDIVLAQSKIEEIKKSIELFDREDQETKQEIDEILRTTEKFIESISQSMKDCTSVN